MSIVSVLQHSVLPDDGSEILWNIEVSLKFVLLMNFYQYVLSPFPFILNFKTAFCIFQISFDAFHMSNNVTPSLHQNNPLKKKNKTTTKLSTTQSLFLWPRNPKHFCWCCCCLISNMNSNADTSSTQVISWFQCLLQGTLNRGAVCVRMQLH